MKKKGSKIEIEQLVQQERIAKGPVIKKIINKKSLQHAGNRNLTPEGQKIF